MMGHLYRILLPAILAVAAAVSMSAQDIDRHMESKARLEKEIEILDRQLADNADRSRDALSRLTLIRKKVSNRKALVAESDRQIRLYSDEIYSAQRKINRLQAREDTLTEYYARLVKSAYRNRDARIWYMYILASEDLGQAFRRFSYFRELSSEMKAQAREIRALRAEQEAEKARLQDLKSAAEKVRVRRQADLKSLQQEENQSSMVVTQLKRNRTRYQKELNAKKKQVDALNREIRRLVEEAMKSASGNKGETAAIDYHLAEEFSANKGKLPWPAEGPVIDHFGQHYHPVFTRLKLPFNNGMTIALAKGSSVKAVFDGVVKQIVVMPGYNQCVLVQHGNYFSFYCKLKTTSVKAGDKVKTGQTIGEVDTINGETQLHFQIWKDQTPQNPEQWLR
ncbi:MAG: peptidoglycan DD-metalloendopeptidase family protein [Bacteroidetes bacterium]|uniref:Peptidoglycan DD-metalloendopeptidase family protein n=1 Tax=Candidatus Cryptobacteroides intestinavium TaxID=2840766 RepID=A0A9D9ENV0_9BACT|nr:peptidoglycan DD-metalloendopeptidase family protein [Candidatus Cryptobacteroides intestinavium]